MKQTTRLAATVAVLALALTGCGTSAGDDDDDGSTGTEEQGGFTAPDVPMADGGRGHARASLSVLAWPGYAEDGSTDKSVDWVTPLRGGDGLPGRRQVLRHLRRGGEPDEVGSVRRGVRLGRRVPATHRRR